jgi:DNA-binding transcriptional regulator LsrR (DeoR family)
LRIVAGRGGEQTGPGGPVAGQLVLLVAVYYRINLTDRQIALLFGISKSAVSRVIAHLAHC